MHSNRSTAQRVVMALTVGLITAVPLAPAHADDSEIMNGGDTGWMDQAPPQGNGVNPAPRESANNQEPRQQNGDTQAPQQGNQGAWANQQPFAAPPAGFHCPSGWSCTPKIARPKPEAEKCKSRFSRCYRKKMGSGGGGGDD